MVKFNNEGESINELCGESGKISEGHVDSFSNLFLNGPTAKLYLSTNETVPNEKCWRLF